MKEEKEKKMACAIVLLDKEKLAFETYGKVVHARRKQRQELREAAQKKSKTPFSHIQCKNPKCKGPGDVSYNYVQNRSMDEGTSTKLVCNKCHLQWLIAS